MLKTSLQSLHVHNFALLEDAQAEFTQGFNVFTGETGAGKSILIDAFGIVLGGRASADYVRSGTDGFWVQAVFDISKQPFVKKTLLDHGLEAEDDLFLKRQVSAAGKGKAYINGTQVPLSVLREIGAELVDIHGQHENQALLKPEAARNLVDSFLDGNLLSNYIKWYSLYVEAKEKLDELLEENDKQDLLIDRYAWEINEIERASLVVGEEEELEAEAKLLANSERILKAVNRAYKQLDDEDAVLSQLANARDELQHAARYDEKLRALAETLDSAWISLDDTRTELSDYLASTEFNEEHAANVQERLDTIYRLQKKYGGSTESVLAYLEATQVKLNELQNIAAVIAKAQDEVAKCTQRLTYIAEQLTQARQEKAVAIADKITRHIRDLAMPDGQLQIVVEPTDKFMVHGADNVRILFSANLGEPLNDLDKVASGGELSRIALAVKTVMMNSGDVSTMVFDEIDTGVGGVTAQRMAEKIAAIATVGQVLCITHLPQIAAFADNHLHIAKSSESGRTVTTLTKLDYNDRLTELVRMTAGDNASAAAYESATELLQKASSIKKSLQQEQAAENAVSEAEELALAEQFIKKISE